MVKQKCHFNMKKVVFLLGIVLFSLTLNAQTEVVKVNKNTDCSESLVYYLPRTVVVLEVEADHEIRKVGPYYKYSERYMGVGDFVIKDEDVWTVKNISIQTKGVPDDNNCYAIKINDSQALNVALTENGIIKGINNPQESPKSCCKKEKTTSQDLSFSNKYYIKEMLQSGSVSRVAELLANQVYQIREYRMDMFSGNVKVPDSQTLPILLEEMQKQEEEIMALFIGKRIKENLKFYVEIPVDKDVNETLAFRFSVKDGIVDNNDFSGKPYYISVKTEPKKFSVSNNKKAGIYYCVPGSANIVITDGKDVLAEKKVQMSQFGNVFSFPASSFDKTPIVIDFDEKTGAIIKIERQ